MGNAEVHKMASVRDDQQRDLDLSKSLNYKQYCRHVEGRKVEPSLTELPCTVTNSLSLHERMTASFNSIHELPLELPLRLPHLCYLDLSHNELSTLPENFGLLLQLETLLLRFNRIKMLPDSMFHLVKLKKLDLCHNHLKTIQNNFTLLQSLEKLDLSHNKLKVLPTSLGGVKTLKVLLATDNRLCEKLDAISKRGSDELLSLLRKNFNLSGQYAEQMLANNNSQPVFPRVRGDNLSTSVVNPHSAQMQYIQSQTHTSVTLSRCKTPLLPPPGGSALEAYALRDKILGLIYGAAIGDALGLATCCMSLDECHFHYNSDNIQYKDILKDEVRVRWKQGDWTSNFDTLVLLLEGILRWAGVVDELEYAKRLHKWCQHGFPELGDRNGIVLSETVRQVIEHPDFTRNPHYASVHVLNNSPVHVYKVEHTPQINGEEEDDSDGSDSSLGDESYVPLFPSSHPCITAAQFGTDNGAVVSVAILGVPFFHRCEEVELNTVRICKATHSHPVCMASCVLVTNLIAQMLQGKYDLQCSKTVEEMISRAVTMATRHITDADVLNEFNRYTSSTSLASLELRQEYNMAYVLKATSAGVLAVRSQQSFRTFMMSLFHEGGDSNSNGCVAGALLGCKLGYSKLPPDWLHGLRVEQTQWLNAKVNHLLDMIGLP